MTTGIMTVVQCWDDGVASDRRLTELLRRNGARATFNLNAGLHQSERSFGWEYAGTRVDRLGLNEIREVYEGFTIANHSLTHPHLETLSSVELRHEIGDGRKRLQDLFGQEVSGFVYPFGTWNDAVIDAVREAGHVYARTAESVLHLFPPVDPMLFHPSCHFGAEDFQERYEQARSGGVFYFWGHSYELISESMWEALEARLVSIRQDANARWGVVADLFA